MSLDRRIVSILYFNGIEDVELVQEFIGEKNGYYEVLINDELRKLKIPGHNYPEEVKIIAEDEIFTSFEYQEEIKNDKIKEVFKQKTFEEELLEAKKSSEESDIKVSVEVYNVPSVSIEEIKEEVKDEVAEFIGEVKEKIKKPKKLKIVESKDDDDFINTI